MNATCVSTSKGSVIVLGSTAAASVLICSLSLCLIAYLRLHKKLVYRLAAYQVFGGLLFGGISTFQLLFLNYNENPGLYGPLCITVAFVHQYTIDVKLLFALCLTFHLFCFVVLDKNLKRLEVFYVVTSMVIPLVLAVIPFITKTYGLAGSWCWIENRVNNCPNERSVPGLVEQFALLYAPAAVALVLQSVAMVTVLVVLFRRKNKAQLIGGKVHDKAFKQVLPLTTYPIAFCFLIVPPLVNRVYGAVELSPPPNALIIVASFCYPLWSFMSGLALFVHICYLKLSSNPKSRPNKQKTNQLLQAPVASPAAGDEGIHYVQCELEF